MSEITWLGHACFRLKSKEATVITDPYDKSLGLGSISQRADIVTMSHDHAHHSTMNGIKGEPFIIRGPGEFEVKSVFVTGVWSYADDKGGKENGRNTIYLFHFDDLVVCHLGSLGHSLNSHQVQALGEVDVLLVPVGGHGSLNSTKAVEVISQIEPNIVIPMHYATERENVELDPLDKFTKEMGLKEWQAQEKLVVKKADLAEGTKVVVLEMRS